MNKHALKLDWKPSTCTGPLIAILVTEIMLSFGMIFSTVSIKSARLGNAEEWCSHVNSWCYVDDIQEWRVRERRTRIRYHRPTMCFTLQCNFVIVHRLPGLWHPVHLYYYSKWLFPLFHVVIIIKYSLSHALIMQRLLCSQLARWRCIGLQSKLCSIKCSMYNFNLHTHSSA